MSETSKFHDFTKLQTFSFVFKRVKISFSSCLGKTKHNSYENRFSNVF